MYLSQARSNLRVAELALAERQPDPSASRSYYAAFHAAISALSKLANYCSRGEQWGHDEIAAKFALILTLRQKVFGESLGESLYDLMRRRHPADYKPESISLKVAERCFSKAQHFVRSIEQKLGDPS
ncbi:MAG: HEPN domain-containing protein [Acidobacteria bacterium]|nr:HEPN domain-containing protein [Acidobacteriota bacterium]MBI3658679.1 HEPN domain-containing protein [Acidobacteriota bacterium]